MSDNMMVPSAYHLDASINGDSKYPLEEGKTPFIYPAGMGQILMNGCWGKDYKIGDPCYNAKENSSLCRVRINIMKINFKDQDHLKSERNSNYS